MAIAPRSSRRSSIDIWPGFVDALAQLLMVIIFILLVFTAGQFYLSEALSGRDQALLQLQQQVNELGNLLALQLREIESLRRDLDALKSVRADLEGKVAALAQQQAQQDLAALRDRTKELETRLAAERERTSLAQKEISARDTRLRELANRAEQGIAAEKEISRNAL